MTDFLSKCRQDFRVDNSGFNDFIGQGANVIKTKKYASVDDNPDFIVVISRILTKLGHAVTGETESLMALHGNILPFNPI